MRTHALAITIAAIIATPAFAGGKATPSAANVQGQLQGQLQAQESSASAGAVSGSSAISSTASGAYAAGGNSGGNAFSTHYESRSRGIAVALPGATADEGSTAPCLESRRGIIIAGNGVSGRTRINEECLEMLRAETKFEQCVALADRLAEWGQLPLAYEQLKRCGAVEGEIVVVADDNFVTREQLDRAFADAMAK